MSERTERMIHSVSPWEQDDPHVQGVMVAVGTEYDLIEEMMVTVRDHAWPQRADDTYGLLSVHEAAAQLPVAPEGVSVATRQSRLRSVMQYRRDGRKGTWARRMDELVGPGLWTAEEHTPGDNQLLVSINALPSSGLALVYAPAIERFTPVVYEVTVTYAPTFILGESPLGDTEL
jgi:hypothetical protein